MRDLTDREIIQLLFGLPITGPDGIITAPGVLVVKAESATDNSDVILEAVDTSSPNACVHSVVDRMTRYFNGVAFTFSVPEEFINTELRFTVDSGVFLRTLAGVKEMHFGMVLLNAGTQIFPPNETFSTRTLGLWDGSYRFRWINLDGYAPAFMEIVLREEEHIVGYAVIKISPIEDLGSELGYVSQLLRSVSFPKVDGQYQDISEEYVAEQIRRVKNDAASQHPTYIDPDAAHEIDVLKERTALRSQSHLLQEDITILQETVQEIKDALADEANRLPGTNVWIVRHLSHTSKAWGIGDFVP